MKIPIAMVCDANYVIQTRVAIWSMRKNTDIETLLEITILCAAELSIEARRRLIELEDIFPNLRILFYEVDSRIFEHSKPAPYVPVASFYRLIISEAISGDKCLYLDGDVIVKTDLKELYDQNVEDVYIAGVRDMKFLTEPSETIKHMDKYEFRERSYVNAGVLIFNLAKIREDKIQGRFLSLMQTFYRYMDQDILNKACEGMIRFLDRRYNVFSRFMSDELGENWEILHFVGPHKPWNNYRILGAKEWWQWAEAALNNDEYETLYKQAKNNTEKSDWSFLLSRCRDEDTIIIFGASYIGLNVSRALQRCNVMANILYCDNDKEKQKMSNEIITIHSVEELITQYKNALWVNTSQNYYEEICHQLISLGIKEDRIIRYKEVASLRYFELLEPEYVEYELEQLKVKISGSNQSFGEKHQ